jgi:aminoglycoside phosphotransferase (APT) family kinase protein
MSGTRPFVCASDEISMAELPGHRHDVRVPLHADEIHLDVSLVRALVDRAFPEYAGHALEAARDSGSSNALFRLGSDLVVRLPRQPGGGATIDKEARWLPYVGERVTVAVPEIVGIGEPALGYGERWAITRWLDGAIPAPGYAASRGLATDLARFVRELRAMEVPAGAAEDESLSWYRGERLSELDQDFRESVDECRGLGLDLDLDDVLRVWGLAAEASRTVESAPAWYHGDLLAENLLVRDGRLAAVLDFGGLSIGDPTVDLAVAWEVLDEQGRREFRQAVDVDDATWAASRGWALLIAVITFPYYGATMPRRCADRLAMAHAALAG